MQFGREINRLLAALLLAFLLVGLSASYWAVFGPVSILLRDDNPRLVEAEAAIMRGDIVDRHGDVLVTSVRDDNGVLLRRYLYPEFNGALGYFSLRYGVNGAEAAYDGLLRGDALVGSLDDYVGRQLLHRPQRGTAVQLSFDLQTQQAVMAAMGGHTGAAVVLAVPSGEVLALVSLPAYNPNVLDAQWDTLVAAPGNPFFNRVLQGSYQPGGMLQIPLMVGALVQQQPLTTRFEDADTPVQLTTVTDGTQSTFAVTCLQPPPAGTLTLAEAYVYGCPTPFVELAETLGAQRVQQIFDMFLLGNPPTLAGFVVQPPATTASAGTLATPTAFVVSDTHLLADALGQGQITLSPLHMAVIVSALLNHGNAPQPQALLATRDPGAGEWTPAASTFATTPLTTPESAQQLQMLMREAVANGSAAAAARAGYDIGGQTALAYAGTGSKTWFAGFVTLADGRSAVVVIVLENSSDPAEAARIGGLALQAAADGMQND
ncbi:MAG: hypothetical protein HXY40_15215 [Chloroflexi bacterium]|nr:hypothetical protein [Chloroflexota bacterium]